jgi:hypothetical protein
VRPRSGGRGRERVGKVVRANSDLFSHRKFFSHFLFLFFANENSVKILNRKLHGLRPHWDTKVYVGSRHVERPRRRWEKRPKCERLGATGKSRLRERGPDANGLVPLPGPSWTFFPVHRPSALVHVHSPSLCLLDQNLCAYRNTEPPSYSLRCIRWR